MQMQDKELRVRVINPYWQPRVLPQVLLDSADDQGTVSGADLRKNSNRVSAL